MPARTPITPKPGAGPVTPEHERLAADLNPGRLTAELRALDTRLFARAVDLHAEPLGLCCAHLVEQLTAHPSFAARAAVEQTRRSGRTEGLRRDLARTPHPQRGTCACRSSCACARSTPPTGCRCRRTTCRPPESRCAHLTAGPRNCSRPGGRWCSCAVSTRCRHTAGAPSAAVHSLSRQSPSGGAHRGTTVRPYDCPDVVGVDLFPRDRPTVE
ncbi:hypothetical protein ACFU53_21435 [Streptomyces sp. NPDC057474]|uniref:NACHT N-terminal Helical domain 1-containing protein n=1 Tax=Streptomyces sp. NPDC057474 TaxID=3346144 RepID=UPI0036AE87C1